MNVIKTKAVSELLGVSQTTIKRWASHFSSAFPKDHLGHYVFSEEQVSLLLYIQDRIEQDDNLDQIILPNQEQITPSSTKPITPPTNKDALRALGAVTLPAQEHPTPLIQPPTLTHLQNKHLHSPVTPIDEMLSRINEVERSLGQKADEVVSAQVLQHRLELEELRKTVTQLAASIETIRNPEPKPFFTPQNDRHNAADVSASRPKKKRFFLF